MLSIASAESSPAGRPGGASAALPPGPECQLLVVFAPRRAVVELWRPLGDVRLGALRLDERRHGLLLAQPPRAAAGGLAVGATAAAPNSMWLLDAERLQALDLTDDLLAICAAAGA